MKLNHSKFWDIIILIFFIAGVTYIVMFLLGERAPDFSIPSKNFYHFISTSQPVIIDLRQPEEIEKQPLRYPSTEHYPFLELEKDISELSNAIGVDTTQTYLLVCSDGNRSRLISFYLASQEITTFYLRDGLWGVPAAQLDQLSETSE